MWQINLQQEQMQCSLDQLCMRLRAGRKASLLIIYITYGYLSYYLSSNMIPRSPIKPFIYSSLGIGTHFGAVGAVAAPNFDKNIFINPRPILAIHSRASKVYVQLLVDQRRTLPRSARASSPLNRDSTDSATQYEPWTYICYLFAQYRHNIARTHI